MAVIVRPGLNIGAMSAEDDNNYLSHCLVTTSDMHQIRDMGSPKCIALGRTGSGKSAIMLNLEKTQDNVIRINPESLSMNYISNSTILNFFEKVNVKLDVFYQLLWRHILAVELLKVKKRIVDEQTSRNFINSWLAKFSTDQRKKRALQYLTEFGDSFWVDTEQRVREVVHRIEKSFEDELGFSVDAFQAKLAADLKDKNLESIQQTTEIIHKAQKVVNSIQIQELNGVIDILADDIFNDAQQKYYIVIDDLDTGWVHDGLRFKLVRALIETVKKFRRIPNLKVILGLRSDLLETVLSSTSSAGFQTEKYEDTMLRLRWTRDELLELADKRIAYSFRDQYTNKIPNFYDVFSPKVGSQEAFDYILERTLFRPRDLIS